MQVFVNHEELLNEVLNSFIMISRVLPRVELITGLYTDPLIQGPLEDFSTLLVTHFNETLRLYEESRLTHIWKALIKPYSVRFQETIQAIKRCTDDLERSGDTLTSREVLKISGQLDGVQLEQENLKDVGQETKAMIIALHRATTCELLEIKMRIHELHIADMIKSASTDSRLDPATNLRQQLGFARRQKVIVIHLWSLGQFAAWIGDPLSSSLLVLGTLAHRKQVYAAAALMANKFQTQQMPVVWISKPVGKALPSTYSPIDILMAIAKRLLQISSDHLTGAITKDFNATHAVAGSSEDHWVSIVASAIRPLAAACLIIDLHLVDNGGISANIKSTVRAIQSVQRQCGATNLKVLYVRIGRLSAGNIADHVLDVRDVLGQAGDAKTRGATLQRATIKYRGRS